MPEWWKKSIESGIAAVLAADAELERPDRAAPEPRGHADHLADPGRVERLERRAVDDLELDVTGEDAALDVVAREPEGGLGQVVRAEREEVRVRRDEVGLEARPRQLDHRPDEEVGAALEAEARGDPDREVAHELELALVGDERDHDLDLRRRAGALAHRGGRAEDRLELHLGDVRREQGRAGRRACRASG
jgi:hypothetical protein